eukprot:gene47764-3621_t
MRSELDATSQLTVLAGGGGAAVAGGEVYALPTNEVVHGVPWSIQPSVIRAAAVLHNNGALFYGAAGTSAYQEPQGRDGGKAAVDAAARAGVACAAATFGAFAAASENGTLLAWGNSQEGGSQTAADAAVGGER